MLLFELKLVLWFGQMFERDEMEQQRVNETIHNQEQKSCMTSESDLKYGSWFMVAW